MLCSVVIPCHGGADDTRACVRSLREQEGGPDLEILLVDNASSDDTPRLGREFAGVRVLRQTRNLGFAGGVNAGLREARGEWLLVVNNDTCAAPDLLARMLAAAQRDARIGLTAPVSNCVKGEALVPAGNAGATADGRRRIAAALASECEGMVQDVSTLSGLCLLMPRAAWQRIGALDERFGTGNFEDDDYCLRARLLGYRLVIARDAFLHHAGHRTFSALGLDYATELAQRRQQFFSKWRDDPAGAAWSARLLGRPDAAAGHAGRALGEHPAWPDAHWILGDWHARLGNTARALHHLECFVRLCPFHGEAHGLRGIQWTLLGDHARGRAILDWTLRECFVSTARAAAFLAGTGRALLRHGRAAAAVDLLSAATEQAPDDGAAHNLLGAALLQCGRLDEAHRPLLRALELGDTEAHTNLGITAWRQGMRSAALASFRAAVAARPDDPEARANLEMALQAAASDVGG